MGALVSSGKAKSLPVRKLRLNPRMVTFDTIINLIPINHMKATFQ